MKKLNKLVKWLITEPSEYVFFGEYVRKLGHFIHQCKGHHWKYIDESTRICVDCSEKQQLMLPKFPSAEWTKIKNNN